MVKRTIDEVPKSRSRLTKFCDFRLSLAPFPPSTEAAHVACLRCLTCGLFLWLRDSKKRAVWRTYRRYLCFVDLTLSVVCFLFKYDLSCFFSRISVGLSEVRTDGSVKVWRIFFRCRIVWPPGYQW